MASPANSRALRALGAAGAAGTASEAGRRAPLRPGTRATSPGPAGARGRTLLSLPSFAFALGGPRARGPPFEPRAGHLGQVVRSSAFVLGPGEAVVMVAVRAPVRSPKTSRSRQRMAWRVREGMQGIRDLEAPCLDALSGLPGVSISPSPRRFCRLEGRRACGSGSVGCVEGSENGTLGAVDGRDPGAGRGGGVMEGATEGRTPAGLAQGHWPRVGARESLPAPTEARPTAAFPS